ncbi:MAG: hypothetical protein WAQ98_32500 [Blastocatellia bacterium]
MRINSSSNLSNVKINDVENNQTKATNNNFSSSETIITNQVVGKDPRASMRSAENGIGARMVASQLQNGPEVSLENIKNNLSSYLRSGKEVSLEPKEKTVSQIFGNDAFQDNLTGDGKSKSKDSVANAKAASSTQATASATDGAPMSLGALLAMVGSIMVKAIEKTMKNLEDAAKQLDAAVGSGANGSSPATNPTNPASNAGNTDANQPGNTQGANGNNGADGANGVGSSPLDPMLEKLSKILVGMEDLVQELAKTMKQLDLNSPGDLENNPELSNLLNKMKSLQEAALQLGADGPKMMQEALAKASVDLTNLDKLADSAPVHNHPITNNASTTPTNPTPQTSPITSNPSPKGGGSGPTAALNQKIQELTFNLQQLQQSLNRVNETVTNLSRSQSDAQKTAVQNLAV